LAHDKVKRQARVNGVMKFRVPQNGANFLTSYEIVSLRGLHSMQSASPADS